MGSPLYIFLLSLTIAVTTFTDSPQSQLSFCKGKNQTLTWKYKEYDDTGSAISLVVWKLNNRLILGFDPSLEKYDYGPGYSKNKIQHISNGKITLYNLNETDSGVYECTVTYKSGNVNSSVSHVHILPCPPKPDTSSSISSHLNRAWPDWLITLNVVIMLSMY